MIAPKSSIQLLTVCVVVVVVCCFVVFHQQRNESSSRIVDKVDNADNADSASRRNLNEIDVDGSRVDCNGRTFASLKEKYIRDGYVVYRSCSLKAETVDAAAKYTGTVGFNKSRLPDAFMDNDAIMDIATDKDTLEILAYLNGKSVFPFQTLNFPVATQQMVHSDAIHFDTFPQRGLMTAAWVALEDIHPDSGPLIYYPGSHKMGMWDLDELGVRLDQMSIGKLEEGGPLYTEVLAETIKRLDLKPEYGIMKKGESFLWAASLLHGGSKLNDPNRTRLSQVTHYFMVGAKRFWIPWRSIPSIDFITYKCAIPVCMPAKGNMVDCGAKQVERFRSRKLVDIGKHTEYGVACK